MAPHHEIICLHLSQAVGVVPADWLRLAANPSLWAHMRSMDYVEIVHA